MERQIHRKTLVPVVKYLVVVLNVCRSIGDYRGSSALCIGAASWWWCRFKSCVSSSAAECGDNGGYRCGGDVRNMRRRISFSHVRKSWRRRGLSHGADGGRHTCRAASVVSHLRHVDFHLVQLLLVGYSHLHHGGTEAADRVTLALYLSIECHCVRVKAILDDVEAVVISGHSWHGTAGCNHAACVSMLGRQSCACDKVCLVGLVEVILEIDPPVGRPLCSSRGMWLRRVLSLGWQCVPCRPYTAECTEALRLP